MSRTDRRLTAVEPMHLRDVWPTIRSEISRIEAPDGFMPEDAYAACRANEAVLFLLYVDGKRIGWMILRQIGADLHIWLLHAENGYDVMKIFRADLMGIAHKAKCTMLTFGSTRRGWERVISRHGFRQRHVVFECVVDAPMLSENQQRLP